MFYNWLPFKGITSFQKQYKQDLHPDQVPTAPNQKCPGVPCSPEGPQQVLELAPRVPPSQCDACIRFPYQTPGEWGSLFQSLKKTKAYFFIYSMLQNCWKTEHEYWWIEL